MQLIRESPFPRSASHRQSEHWLKTTKSRYLTGLYYCTIYLASQVLVLLTSWVRIQAYQHPPLAGGLSAVYNGLYVDLDSKATWFWFHSVRLDGLSIEGDGLSVTLRNGPLNVPVVQYLSILGFTVFIGRSKLVDRHSSGNVELSGSMIVQVYNSADPP